MSQMSGKCCSKGKEQASVFVLARWFLFSLHDIIEYKIRSMFSYDVMNHIHTCVDNVALVTGFPTATSLLSYFPNLPVLIADPLQGKSIWY